MSVTARCGWRAAFCAVLAAALGACSLDRITPTPIPQPTATFVPPLTLPDDPLASTAVPAGSPNPNCPSTPPTWFAYRVEPGDTLSLLAVQTQSTVDELVAGNCLQDPNQIEVDAIIYLPRQPVISP